MTTLTRYKLDLTGMHPDNLIEAEVHPVVHTFDQVGVLIVPHHGPFFLDSVQVKEVGGSILPRGDRWNGASYYQTLSERVGKEVCGGLIIQKPTDGSWDYTPTDLEITYQSMGGGQSHSHLVLKQILEDIEAQVGQTIDFSSIIGKPRYYPPQPHMHEVFHVYGMKDIIRELNSLAATEAIENPGVLQELDDFVNYYLVVMGDPTAQEQTDMDNHIANLANPHGVTKFQIGLGQVENYPPATATEMTAGTSTSHYVTSIVGWNHVISAGKDPVDAHVANLANPHGTTAADLGIYTTTELDNLLSTKMDLTGTAQNADRLGNQTYTEIYATVHLNVPVGNVTYNMFNPARLGSGFADQQRVLRGDGSWEYLASVLAPIRPDPVEHPYDVVFLDTALPVRDLYDLVVADYSDPLVYPPGTLIVAHGIVTTPYGLGPYALSDENRSVFLARRRTGGWDFMHQDDQNTTPLTHELV